eukprot:CAMPEP_0116870412 /NCGR_PEP_ID=MMETSP0463-20121206/300_1 /TAXON_ID=181622 /ORGANISM="Strombidinopsis sp, Strain SopsisLIS2011" /LENGTH=63 /DNA_ID=CAMNT_0004506883 /DNA_START=488 /DNA_END=679 /DNA_ORIENTATION=+
MLKGTHHLIIPNKSSSSDGDITNCHNTHGSGDDQSQNQQSNDSQGIQKTFVNNSISSGVKTHR